jgi:hypothetical protein
MKSPKPLILGEVGMVRGVGSFIILFKKTLIFSNLVVRKI